jgi:hypothetical protein
MNLRWPLVWRSTLEAQAAKHAQIFAENDVVWRGDFVKFVGKLKADYESQLADCDRKIEKLTKRNEALQEALGVKMLKGAA